MTHEREKQIREALTAHPGDTLSWYELACRDLLEALDAARSRVAALEAQVRRARAEAFEEAAVWMDGHLCEYCVTNHLPNPLKKLDDAEAEFCPRTSCWDIDAVRKHFRERASALRSQAAKEK